MRRKNKIYIGVDIGGTTTRVAVLRGLKKQRVVFASAPTPKESKRLENILLTLIRRELKKRLGQLAGIGVGFAGMVDRRKGEILSAPNLPKFNGWNAVAFLKRHFKVPVRLDNDARCFLRAEAAWGAARGKKNIVGIAIGTGIGGALMINGKMVYGVHDSAGEIGHMVLSGGKTFEKLGALKAFRRLGDRSRIIGMGIADLINTFDPEMVVIGGGAVRSSKFSIAKVKAAAHKYIQSPQAQRTKIVKGKLGDAAQATGAALLFDAV